MEKLLDKDKSLFVFYVNVGNMSALKAKEKIAELSKNWNYSNANFWIIPVRNQETRIERIW